MTTLVKFPEEKLKFSFNFSSQPELIAGATLTGTPSVANALVVGTGSLTLSNITVNGENIDVWIEGGTLHDIFDLTCSVSASDGSTLAAKGRLLIARVG
jgi:hypothetical protein